MELVKLLYISNYWSGFSDLYEEGAATPSGMPGFLKPLQHFIQSGLTVEIIFLTKHKTSNVSCPWLKNVKIHFIDPKKSKIKILSFIRSLINQSGPNFIYAHGSMPAFYAGIANIGKGIPLGKRFYGTFLVEKLNQSFFSAVLKYPYEIIALNTPARFLLITNDGTKGDEVYDKFCFVKRFLPLYFWENGVDQGLLKSDIRKQTSFAGAINILVPARYDRWKRQDRILLLAKKLKDQGIHIDLIFCGHIYDKSYFAGLMDCAKKLGLNENTSFLGPVPPDQLTNLILKTDFIPFFYDFSNYGNVFIECSLLGAFIVVLNDGSTDTFSKKDKVNLLVENEDDAAKQILHYMNNLKELDEIRRNCKNNAKIHYKSWSDRIVDELTLIKQSM